MSDDSPPRPYLARGSDFSGLPPVWQVERLRTVYTLTDAVSRARGLDEIYEAALRGLERALATDRASILLFDADGVMRFKAWHGLSDRYRAAVEGHSPWSRDALQPEPIVVPDVFEDEALRDYAPLFRAESIRSLGFIPLLYRERLIGKFMVYFDRPHTLDEEELRLARTIAGHVAFAVVRKSDEERLTRYREIFAHSSEAIAILDAEGRYVEQNEAHRALMGYEDDQLTGRTPALHLGDAAFASVAEALASNGVFRGEMASTTHSGCQRAIELSAFAVRGEHGELVCHVGIERDVTERKRTEEALQFLAGASAALDRSLDYDATLREVVTLVVPFLGDWAIIETAEAPRRPGRMLGAHADPSRSAAMTRMIGRLESSEGAERQRRAAAGGARKVDPVMDLLGDRGDEADARKLLEELGAHAALSVPLRARGQLLGTLILVSERRTYDERDQALAEDLAHRAATALDNARLYREAQESDRRKDEFLAVLAHELRNPMMPLLTCVELMRADETTGDRSAQRREIMERQVRNLKRLVDDLLDVSRVTRGKIELQKQTIGVAGVVTRAVETTRSLYQGRDLRLSVFVDPAARLEADPLRLEQILANLLQNAAKYTPAGGEVQISGSREGDSIVLRVRDSGIGIAPEMLSHVFDLFVQEERERRSCGGLGVGLTLVRSLVELHGGSVTAVSAGPGLGSEFEVRLPATVTAPERESAPTPVARVVPRRVLVVDDNVDAATMLTEALCRRGHEVHTAHTGRAALEMATRLLPDVVLLDLGLPDLDGYEVARQMRSTPALERTTLIALTGYGQIQDRERSIAAGLACHAVKPIDLLQLDAVLDISPPAARSVDQGVARAS